MGQVQYEGLVDLVKVKSVFNGKMSRSPDSVMLKPDHRK